MDNIVEYLGRQIDQNFTNVLTGQLKLYSEHLELMVLEQIHLANASKNSIHYSYILILNTYISKKISCDHQVILNMFLEIHSEYSQYQTTLTNSYIEYLEYRLQFGKLPDEKIYIIENIKKLAESQIDPSKLFSECNEKLSMLVSNHILIQNLIDSPTKIEKTIGYLVLSKLFILYLPGFDLISNIQEIFIKYYKLIKISLFTLPGKKIVYNNTLKLLSLYANYSILLNEQNNCRLTKISKAVFNLGLRFGGSNTLEKSTKYQIKKSGKFKPALTFEKLKVNTKNLINPSEIDTGNTIINNKRKGYHVMIANKLNKDKNTTYKIYTLLNGERKVELISNEIYALELTSSLKAQENCFISYYGFFIDQPKIGISMEEAGVNMSLSLDNLLNESSLKSIFKKLVHSYQELKLHGILHCDIKPGNITFTKTNEPKIIDYGACIITKKPEKIKEYKIRGTQSYSSPQLYMLLGENSHLQRLRIDYEKNDVFSLGMVFLELASQISCHKMNNPSEHFNLMKRVEDLNIQSELKDIIRSMLCLDSMERPTFLEILSRINIVE